MNSWLVLSPIWPTNDGPEINGRWLSAPPTLPRLLLSWHSVYYGSGLFFPREDLQFVLIFKVITNHKISFLNGQSSVVPFHIQKRAPIPTGVLWVPISAVCWANLGLFLAAIWLRIEKGIGGFKVIQLGFNSSWLRRVVLYPRCTPESPCSF